MSQLVIAQSYDDPEQLNLMFCDEQWQVHSVLIFFDVEEAKIKAEKGYQGIGKHWKKSPYTQAQIDDFLRNEYQVDPQTQWWVTLCSFCEEDVSEAVAYLKGKNATICRDCIVNFANIIDDP